MEPEKSEKQMNQDESKELSDKQLEDAAGGYLPYFEQTESEPLPPPVTAEHWRL